jgi:hypothetical protein
LSHESQKIAEAEPVSNVEGHMCSTVMRGADAPPGSKSRSRRKRTCRNLGGLVVGRTLQGVMVRVGKARSRSRR